MGGVVVSSRSRTSKSAMARDLHLLLHPIDVIKDSPLNIDGDADFVIDEVFFDHQISILLLSFAACTHD